MTDNAHSRFYVGIQIPAGADFRSALELTRTAERGLLDFVLSENVTVLAALVAATERIGLVAAVEDTGGSAPFEVARRLATLDHLSDGRAGWTADGAEEFVTVVTKFWDTWAPGAVLADRDTGRYIDPDRVRAVDHRGPQLAVRGVAALPAHPRGYPVLVQGFSRRTDDTCRFVLAADELGTFVDAEVPRLQERGTFRTEYTGHTLREHLGL